ncbi:UbiD family decarboxylase [Planctopirus hydrillae]|uniref:3-octaprenyl-4-hydroxybenzoate carboxy-lyase n=1 Tax=Planctopirus hydrillae TaxID=1841610 RepID=A0A1C3E467_9PLAN|nr:UbiD family decarboxylase [Planctopirus hydrillae]ODA28041.1 hypothetical protein A6X21_14355 [Planctopirus hydrillae]
MKTVCSIGAFVQALATQSQTPHGFDLASSGRAAEAELIRITVAVDPREELFEIVRQIDQLTEFPPVIVFDDVRGSQFPVVVNLLATEQRCARMLGVPHWSDISQLFPFSRATNSEAKGFLWSTSTEPIIRQRTVASQQVIRLGGEVDLSTLPGIYRQSQSPHPSLFHAHSITRGTGGDRSVERCHLSILDSKTLICDWPLGSASQRHLEEARAAGQPLPVAFVIGSDTASYAMDGRWMNLHPACWGRDLWEFLGRQRESGFVVARARTSDIDVAGDAEMILEGVIDTGVVNVPHHLETRRSGWQSEVAEFPLARINAVTHRALPLVPMVLPETRESHLADRLLEQVSRSRLSAIIPELNELYFPALQEGHQLIVASLRSSEIGRARQFIHALWSLPILSEAKLVIIVDDDVNIRDQSAVWRAIVREADFSQDIEYSRGTGVPWSKPPGSNEFLSQYHPGMPWKFSGQKIGIDATRKRQGSGPDDQSGSATIEKVKTRWDEYGLSKFLRTPGLL